MNKKLILYLCGVLLILMLSSTYIFNFNKKETNKYSENYSITLAEVAHTVFYAPMYVAIEKKYFEANNLDVNLILTSGADKVATALISGDADIGLSGAEATIYVYNKGEKDYLKTFAQLTQKDGSFIVSREKINNFSLDDLKGKTIIGGRAAGMPEMILEYALKEHGINPREDLNIDTSISFAAMGGTFIGGYGDFVSLFEPTASKVEKEGYGYVVKSLGELGGIVPYTSFSAKKSFINNNKETINNFNKAIKQGLDYVHNHSDNEVAKVILNEFPDTSLDDLVRAIKRYREIDAWPKDTYFKEEAFNHLQDIMIDYGELINKVAYNELVYKIK